jgi:hypothetical protein
MSVVGELRSAQRDRGVGEALVGRRWACSCLARSPWRVGSLVRVIPQEHVPGLAEVTVLVRRGGRVVPIAMRLDGAKGRWELVELQY